MTERMTFQLMDGQVVEAFIIRSRRKTIYFSVNEDGTVEIKIPKYLTKNQLLDILEKKADWIDKARQRAKEKQQNRKTLSFVNGSMHWYEGKSYMLRVIEDETCFQPNVTIENSNIIVTVFHQNELIIKNILMNWYYKQALEKIENIIVTYKKHFVEQKIGTIKIKGQKTCWGSCSSKGNLNFNWKLILLSKELLEYVVVHELCHLKEMNHSSQFWNEVGKILPDYKERRKQLKQVDI